HSVIQGKKVAGCNGGDIMKSMIKKKKEITIDKLAEMVQHGFEMVDKRFDDVDKRFEAVDKNMAGLKQQIQAVNNRLDVQVENNYRINRLEEAVERIEKKVGMK
ncbi:MAG: hypothetical protein NTY66_04405, partial [Candidatus Vogelbacteria bacterium]|nr:hypothetical protein [Candidatus Vogelbacteria bacterium]